MTLPAGTRLGSYTVVSALGAGGMGEVYRARDTKLGREVAVKVVPELFAADRDRLARFEREAQVLASLNHPNIAHIYGVEDSGGVRALVMELVEGETLADRLGKGPLPQDEALAIARQISDALEAAHEHHPRAIYLQPFPRGQRQQISTKGGTQIRWRPDGRELYYIATDGYLMAVPMGAGAGPSGIGTPARLFKPRLAPTSIISRQQYVVARDGQRFLFVTAEEAPPSPITLILNWNPRADARP